MAYLGGSGEPPGDKTIFDSTVTPIGRYAFKGGYNVDVAFDGGHATTEQIVSSNFPQSPNKLFTAESYDAVIKQYEEMIKNGAMKTGDQVMLVIDSHGAKRGVADKTHVIASGNGQATDLLSLKGSEFVSLDRLIPLSKLAEERGIRLAVIDLSCHSGASIPLGNTKTCVISASGTDTFAYGGPDAGLFANSFLNALSNANNLEEAFLAGRGQSRDRAFPMISTPEGMRLQDRLYPELFRYLNFRQVKNDKLADELTTSVTSGSCQQEEGQFRDLINLSREIERATDGIDLENFRRALAAYHDYRKNLQNELRLVGGDVVGQMRRLCYTSTKCDDFPVSGLIAMNPDTQIEYFRRQMLTEKNAKDKAHYQELITFNQNAKVAREEIFRQYPRISSYNSIIQNYPNLAVRTEELAGQVAVESRKVYSALYRRDTPTNACRDFVL
ncbi:MAG: hypothetical protein ACJ76H_13120 [Bacteriovoracaceae bacterium]